MSNFRPQKDQQVSKLEGLENVADIIQADAYADTNVWYCTG